MGVVTEECSTVESMMAVWKSSCSESSTMYSMASSMGSHFSVTLLELLVEEFNGATSFVCMCDCSSPLTMLSQLRKILKQKRDNKSNRGKVLNCEIIVERLREIDS